MAKGHARSKPFFTEPNMGTENPVQKRGSKFKRKCDDEKIIRQVRERMHYEKPSEIRNRKKKAAIRRNQKRIRDEQINRSR